MMKCPEIVVEEKSGRTRYIVDGLRYSTRAAAEKAMLRAKERDRDLEIIARLARAAGQNRRN